MSVAALICRALAQADLRGDPLPEGAVARLGTLRFRAPHCIEALAVTPDGAVAAAFESGDVRAWDVASGRTLRRLKVSEAPTSSSSWKAVTSRSRPTGA